MSVCDFKSTVHAGGPMIHIQTDSHPYLVPGSFHQRKTRDGKYSFLYSMLMQHNDNENIMWETMETQSLAKSWTRSEIRALDEYDVGALEGTNNNHILWASQSFVPSNGTTKTYKPLLNCIHVIAGTITFFWWVCVYGVLLLYCSDSKVQVDWSLFDLKIKFISSATGKMSLGYFNHLSHFRCPRMTKFYLLSLFIFMNLRNNT
jgi:hypothetical protein